MLLWAGAWAATVDLNAATLEQLDRLPGLGRAKSSAIVQHRSAHGPFRSFDDLAKVSALGPATLRLLKPLVRMRDDVVVLELPPRATDQAPLPVVPSARACDPNTATVDQLTAWPGISVDRAVAIVKERSTNGPFATCTDLQRAHGVGPATIAGLRDLCVISL